MPCEYTQIKDKDGKVIGTAFVCSRGKRRVKCKFCAAESVVLCDFEVVPGKTCDAPCCRTHAVRVGDNRDYCRDHARPQQIKCEDL